MRTESSFQGPSSSPTDGPRSYSVQSKPDSNPEHRSLLDVPTSAIKMENLDVFKSKNNGSDVDDSLILETDYYVRQMKQRRNKLMSQIDNK